MSFDPPLSIDELESAFSDKFTIKSEIASGGQGSVFKAATKTQSNPVALKIYFEDQIKERTTREVNALRSISCPTLVKLHDTGSRKIRQNPCIYVATEFIDGQPLSELIQQAPLSHSLVARIGHDIASAIGHLWESRIVHRDIKPNNIMINTQGRAILIDLGLARHLKLESLTSMGKTWGTIGYLSPEQTEAQRALTCKSDVFSLGLVLQESLLGRHPTGRKQNLLMSGGIPTNRLITNAPPALAALIDAMLHKNPLKRPLPGIIQKTLSEI
jgi:serine/threonine-protein kinase